MSPKNHTDRHCQHINARGHRCRMLIASDHRNSHGEERPSLCAYHFGESSRLQPDDDIIAAELLDKIEEFSSADSVNYFLGNLLKQLARKRIARRDAIALAYISQLLLNSLPALRREIDDEKYASANQYLLGAFARSPAAPRAEEQPNGTASAACPEPRSDGTAGKPS